MTDENPEPTRRVCETCRHWDCDGFPNDIDDETRDCRYNPPTLIV